ncbi:MAG: glycerate kinase, partial [Victivallales bacterium]|nr:glycerate kinase [Victivallales bacterium]
MKIILAPDSFKDSLSSINVCSILSEAARRELGDVEIHCFPMGDGGEGTLDAVLAATNGRRETLMVRDPLGRPVEAAYALLPNGEAFVEMAQASGLERLSRDERNPLLTSTYGTGQLILAALDAGCKKITVGIGGSATTDG